MIRILLLITCVGLLSACGGGGGGTANQASQVEMTSFAEQEIANTADDTEPVNLDEVDVIFSEDETAFDTMM